MVNPTVVPVRQVHQAQYLADVFGEATSCSRTSSNVDRPHEVIPGDAVAHDRLECPCQTRPRPKRVIDVSGYVSHAARMPEVLTHERFDRSLRPRFRIALLSGDPKLLAAAEDILSSFGMKVQIVPEPE